MSYDILKSVSQGSDGRKMRKIAESQQSPMNSADFANYMKRNLERAKQM